jgi:hypothetical protein
MLFMLVEVTEPNSRQKYEVAPVMEDIDSVSYRTCVSRDSPVCIATRAWAVRLGF